MRLSQSYIPTQKETPADAVIPSHQLMIRAGLIRPLASGIYSYLPIGWKIMKKVMDVIREEMDDIGGQELQLPAMNPIELWDESGRNTDFGDEMFRLKDRKGRPLCLAPTHEEIICDLARKYIRSYKDMPQIWYQIQTKFRDEPRPRSGVLRTRQFFMKDSYTLDVDADALDTGYELHAKAYRNIFTRCGLKFYIVGASSGLMGGSGSQEFMIESAHGEDTLVLCDGCGQSDNLEIAESIPLLVTVDVSTLEKVHTPGQKTINDVSKFLDKDANKLMKSLVYVSDGDPFMVLIRGDQDVNESKLMSKFGKDVRPAHPDEVKDVCGVEVGFVGPIGLKNDIPIFADKVIENQNNLTTGANEVDYHLTGIQLSRDVNVKEYIDIRNVSSGDNCVKCQNPVRVTQAIELGHIFKLGTKYAESMKATYLDKAGNEKPIVMGSYGIGVERIVAASIEQNADEKGIVWDVSLAPYLIHVIPLNADKKEIVDVAERYYNEFKTIGYDVIIDDRKVSPGFKFKDADLMGMPIQVIIGDKGLKKNQVEIKVRKTGEVVFSEVEKVIDSVQTLLSSI